MQVNTFITYVPCYVKPTLHFTALIYCVYVISSFTYAVNFSERLHFTKKFPEKFWKFRNLPRDILGILGRFLWVNSFLRLYVCIYNTFVINSSGRSPRNFGGSTLFVKKFRNFGKFWKFLEIFGKF